LAILRLVEMEKAVVEGAGAIGLAAVLGDYVPELKGKKYYKPIVHQFVYAHIIRSAVCSSRRIYQSRFRDLSLDFLW